MTSPLTSPWIVVPTFNERQNIARLIPDLFALPIENLHVLIVDDNSPDGTADEVRRLQQGNSRLHLSVQPKKAGLGRAYVHGFGYILERGATAIVQMDADFSHSPQDVPRLLEELHNHDVVIGSRYVSGISVINWPLRRLLLSTGANLYARIVTGLPYKDITGGFRAWRASALSAIHLHTIKADGYGFQVVMAYRAWRQKLRFKEVPIIFTERREGQSKMSKAIMWEAFWLVWKLRLFG
ncbi:MAG TPA: polyprenol monophosphomannose synthase [Candidatus Andersenbacteria bacterium]|nr:MAG: dolichyl-phosphate beta-D-mannosyltransferase [Parcubacteria group bacterium RIFCSPHIGHO2_01_FULL_56_18]HLD25998.1 polyprenol monophosphomannose synthase [Candidatus Andersenbacteria bacterium]